METNAIDTPKLNNLFLTAKRELIVNRKSLLLRLAMIWGVFISLGGIWGYNRFWVEERTLIVMGMLAMLFGVVVGSSAFSNLKTKTGRISALMYPASMFNKYLVRWIMVVPITFIVLIAAFYLFEFSRIIVGFIHDGFIEHEYSRPANLFKLLSFSDLPIGRLLCLCCIASYFLHQALYMFGSALWPRHSFGKTFAALWVIQLILSIISMPFSLNITEPLMTIEELMLLIGIIEIVMTIVLYFLTYLRFRSTQIVYKLF